MKNITIQFGAGRAVINVTDEEAAKHEALVANVNKTGAEFRKAERDAKKFWRCRAEYIDAQKTLNAFEVKFLALAYAQ